MPFNSLFSTFSSICRALLSTECPLGEFDKRKITAHSQMQWAGTVLASVLQLWKMRRLYAQCTCLTMLWMRLIENSLQTAHFHVSLWNWGTTGFLTIFFFLLLWKSFWVQLCTVWHIDLRSNFQYGIWHNFVAPMHKLYALQYSPIFVSFELTLSNDPWICYPRRVSCNFHNTQALCIG